jgi:tRNA1Val (adenine37-N6)-methyltransferase
MSRGFRFKQFYVDDHGCGMPVSTDGVLLGTWAKLPQQGKIVDIGTGSGLLALIAAQRTSHLAYITIEAIELVPGSAKAARHNFSSSPWHHRLHCIEQDVIVWQHSQQPHQVEAIICNPPYFNFGQQATSNHRATARHTATFTHQQLLQSFHHLLTPTGIASIILPCYEGQSLLKQAKDYGLYCHRYCEVRSTEAKPPTRLLLQLSKTELSYTTEQLCIHDNGGYSAEFKALTENFYLKM